MRPVQCMHGLLVPEIFTQCCHKKHEQEIDKEKERERERGKVCIHIKEVNALSELQCKSGSFSKGSEQRLLASLCFGMFLGEPHASSI